MAPESHRGIRSALEGTLYHASAADTYTLPSNAAGPAFEVFTKRIQNDEGAWQGSVVKLDLPDGTTYVAPMVMTGEGAYDGLAAIVGFVDWAGGDCYISGYIIERPIPEPPVPQTGQ